MRVTVLGCGSIGRRHLRNLQVLGQREVIPFDPEPTTRGAVAQEFGMACCATLEDVWQRKPDVALVTAPSQLHVSLATAAAERGCHLFIEKPLAHRLEGVAELCELVERRGLVSMVACNMRFHPGPARVKHLLDEGAIGKVLAARIQCGSYLPGWRPAQDYRQSYSASPEWGGAILDCIHEIDLALWYFGPARVLAAAHVPATTLGLKTDGLAEILLQHQAGALSSVHLNFVQRDYRRTCQIIGAEGTLAWDFAEGKVRLYGSDGKLKSSDEQPANWTANDMYLAELESYLRSVTEGQPAQNTIADGWATLQVALAARHMGTAA